MKYMRYNYVPVTSIGHSPVFNSRLWLSRSFSSGSFSVPSPSKWCTMLLSSLFNWSLTVCRIVSSSRRLLRSVSLTALTTSWTCIIVNRLITARCGDVLYSPCLFVRLCVCVSGFLLQLWLQSRIYIHATMTVKLHPKYLRSVSMWYVLFKNILFQNDWLPVLCSFHFWHLKCIAKTWTHSYK